MRSLRLDDGDDGAAASFLYEGDCNALIATLAGLTLTDVEIAEPTLEEVFMHYYQPDGDAMGADAGAEEPTGTGANADAPASAPVGRASSSARVAAAPAAAVPASTAPSVAAPGEPAR